MLGRRIITCLAGARIPYGASYSRLRAIHVLPAISSCSRRVDDGTNDDRRRRSLLATAVTSSNFGTVKRYKSGKKIKKQAQGNESDSDDDDYLEELDGDTSAKVMTMTVSSLRLDLIVKAGLGLARNKAEVALYDSKIRVNGEKVTKKSQQIRIGDMVDLIRGPSPKNPDFLLVSRIHILSAAANDNGYRIKFTRDKSLVIENYDDSWQPVQ